MITKTLKIIFLVVLIAVVGLIGISVYANLAVFNKAVTGPADIAPAVEDAHYSFRIINTGRVIYANEYTKDGTVYILPTFWEQVKNKYVYRKFELTIDETIFGPVLVKVR